MNPKNLARREWRNQVGDRQVHIEGEVVLETAETANQETVLKLTPKTIQDATKMKPKRAKGPPHVANNTFQYVIFDAKRLAKAGQHLLTRLIVFGPAVDKK